MDYETELTAVQTFIKKAAGLNSWRRTAVPPKLARPVVLWESPYRGRARHLSRWTYQQTIKYYGKLFVNDVAESNRLQELLIQRLEDTCGVLPLTDDKGNRIGWIKNAVFEFNDASDSLDISFTLSYEVAYERARPTEPPAPRYVSTRVTLNEENKERG